METLPKRFAGKGCREHPWILFPSELQAMVIISTRGYSNSAEKKRIGLIAAQPAKWNGRGLIARPAHLGRCPHQSKRGWEKDRLAEKGNHFF